MSINELYNKFLKGISYQMDILPKRNMPNIPLFVEFHKATNGEIDQKNQEQIITLIDKKEIASDYFIFHVLGVIHNVTEDILYKVLKRLRFHDSDILTGSVLRNLHRIFGFDLFSKQLLVLLGDFSTGVELFHNIRILMKYEHDIDYKRYEWIDTRYKIPLGVKSSFNIREATRKSEMIQSYMEKRSSLLLDIILKIDGSRELNEIFRYAIPRIEHVAQDEIEKHALVIEKLKL